MNSRMAKIEKQNIHGLFFVQLMRRQRGSELALFRATE